MIPNEQSTNHASEIGKLLQEADEAFTNMASERLEKGAEKYGQFNFMSVDTLEEAMFELADLANYARMTFIKIYLLRKSIAKIVSKDPRTDAKGFVSLKEFMQP